MESLALNLSYDADSAWASGAGSQANTLRPKGKKLWAVG